MKQASIPVAYWDVRPRGIDELFDGEAKTVPVEIVGEPDGDLLFSTTSAEVARIENGWLTFGAVAGAAVIIVEASRDGMVFSRRYVQVDVRRPSAGPGVPTEWSPTGYVEQLPDGTWHFYYFSEWYDEYGDNIRVTGDLVCAVTLDRDYSLVFDVWGEIESVDGHEMDTLGLLIDEQLVRRFNPTEDINGTPFWPYVIPRRTESIDMSAYTGQTVALRFRWDTGDALYQKFDGWFVKDIMLVPIGG